MLPKFIIKNYKRDFFYRELTTSNRQIFTMCFNFFFQERALHYLDQNNGDIHIMDGISLIQTEQVAQGRALSENELPFEPDQRETEIDALIVDRIARFLGSHTLQFRVPKESIHEMQRSLDEGKISQ